MKKLIFVFAILTFLTTNTYAKPNYTLCADIVAINVEVSMDNKGDLHRTMKILLKELATFDDGEVSYKKRFPDKIHSYELSSKNFSAKDRDVYIRFLESHLMGEDLDVDINWCYLVDENKKSIVKVMPLK